MEQAAPFAEQLGLEQNEMGGIKTDLQGRTSVKEIMQLDRSSWLLLRVKGVKLQ